MMELEALQAVWPQLRALGASLVAISPQLAQYGRAVRRRAKHEFDCPEHRKTAGAATRAVEYRQRIREARRLSKEGRSLKEIVAKLGRPARQVKMWIG